MLTMQDRIAWVLASCGRSRQEIARLTGLKGVSGVSEWLRTGRIHKRHIETLAQLSGTTAEWWIAQSAPIPPHGKWLVGNGELHAAEPAHPYQGRPQQTERLRAAIAELLPTLASIDARTRHRLWAELHEACIQPPTDNYTELARAIERATRPGKRQAA